MKILRTQQTASEPSLKDALPLGTVLSVREQPEQIYMIIESALFLQALDTVLKGGATNDSQRTETNA